MFDYIKMFHNPKRKHANIEMPSQVDFKNRQQNMNEAGGLEIGDTSDTFFSGMFRKHFQVRRALPNIQIYFHSIPPNDFGAQQLQPAGSG